jgi:hypothetical protein
MGEKEARPPIAGPIVLFVGAVLIVVAVGFLTYAFYSWVRVGVWPSYPASKMLAEIGIPYPRLAWEGGQRVLDWLLSVSGCTVLLCIGTLLALVGVRMASAHDSGQKGGEASP